MTKQGVMVVGMAFGDEGKGTMVDYFTRERKATLTVRFNGGPQAAHNVVAGSRHHTFAQFGSGTLAGAETHLSRFCLFEPFAMEQEAKKLWEEDLTGPFGAMSVDPRCTIVTPHHWLANRLREALRGPNRHGSTGFGIGEVRGDALGGRPVLTVGDVLQGGALDILRQIDAYKREEFSNLPPVNLEGLAVAYREMLESVRVIRTEDILDQHNSVVFEGAQGVLLDEKYGFAPYNTWTDTTLNNAQILCNEVNCKWETERVGVLRTYFTRHGPGPFPTEDVYIVAPEENNKENTWAGRFRLGHFDAVLAEYALQHCFVDSVALTHCDTFPSQSVATCYCGYLLHDNAYWCGDTENMMRVVPRYVDVPSVDSLSRLIEGLLERPVRYRSYGPKASDKMKCDSPVIA
jgi:adenylosuccinate synthase